VGVETVARGSRDQLGHRVQYEPCASRSSASRVTQSQLRGAVGLRSSPQTRAGSRNGMTSRSMRR
jgi:hypothetical protein